MKEPAPVTPDLKEELERRIADRSAQIGIIGMGYVGVPLARAFGRAGFRVRGFDVDRERIQVLASGRSPIAHVPDSDVAELHERGRLRVTADPKELRQVDVALICVPTPITRAREPDLSHVRNATEEITRFMNPGTLVVLESTTYPGTTDEIVRPILEESGLRCGVGFFLAFSPEREDPGNPHYSTHNIPKLVGGVDETSGELAETLYAAAVETVVRVPDARTAEAAKVLENTYRSVNIALVNELKMVFDGMGIDIWNAIDAAATKPFGFHPFYPGPGLGGHCIPIDPHYLGWRARQFGLPTRFIDLAGEVNASMPDYVLQSVADTLNGAGKAISASEVLVLGVAYKRDIDDARESPALELITKLKGRGARVHYHDPYVPALTPGHGFQHSLESVPLDEETIANADLVLVVTDHGCVDYELVARHAALLVDTRNCVPPLGAGMREFLPDAPVRVRAAARSVPGPVVQRPA